MSNLMNLVIYNMKHQMHQAIQENREILGCLPVTLSSTIVTLLIILTRKSRLMHP
jgi:hypothetical protein